MRLSRLGLAAAVLALMAVGSALGQEKEHPVVAQVKAKLKDPGRPFTMIVLIQLKEGSHEKFEAAFGKAVGPSRKEKGCIAYDLNRDGQDPKRYLVYERWRDLAALDAHTRSAHFLTLLDAIGELIDGPPDIRVLLPVEE